MKVKPAKKSRLRPSVAPTQSSPTASASRPARTAAVALTPGQITVLQNTFSQVEAQGDIAALIFYRNLFTLDPSLRALFHTDIEVQGRKLMQALHYLVTALKNPGELLPVLEAMGRRHATYGVKDQHYPTLNQAMIGMLREVLGRKFTVAAGTAWKRALQVVAETMQRGARREGDWRDHAAKASPFHGAASPQA